MLNRILTIVFIVISSTIGHSQTPINKIRFSQEAFDNTIPYNQPTIIIVSESYKPAKGENLNILELSLGIKDMNKGDIVQFSSIKNLSEFWIDISNMTFYPNTEYRYVFSMRTDVDEETKDSIRVKVEKYIHDNPIETNQELAMWGQKLVADVQSLDLLFEGDKSQVYSIANQVVYRFMEYYKLKSKLDIEMKRIKSNFENVYIILKKMDNDKNVPDDFILNKYMKDVMDIQSNIGNTLKIGSYYPYIDDKFIDPINKYLSSEDETIKSQFINIHNLIAKCDFNFVQNVTSIVSARANTYS